jgi:hypothetical protein
MTRPGEADAFGPIEQRAYGPMHSFVRLRVVPVIKGALGRKLSALEGNCAPRFKRGSDVARELRPPSAVLRPEKGKPQANQH